MFDVFVVGATDPGDEGLDKLAEAMSARYGLPLEDLRGRLARGRFRVKAKVDRATGETYLRDLTKIGARGLLEPASDARGTSIPPPIADPAPRATASSTAPPSNYQSGLSAAFSGQLPVADLGALGREDTFALASLDGHDGNQPMPQAIAPPPLPPPTPGATPKPPRPRDVPVELDYVADASSSPAIDTSPQLASPSPGYGAIGDRFRPPDAADDDRPVEIAADEIEHRARKRMSTPPASVPVLAPPPASARPAARATATPPRAAIVRAPGRLGPLGDERVRFAAGVVLAILIGFVPAHVIAGMREHASDRSVDLRVEQAQLNATSLEDYAALDKLRDRALDDKRGARHSIAIMAFAIWAAAGAGVGYAWFKRVPWDRLDAPRPA